MSKYNSFARELDTIAHEAFSEIEKLDNAVEAARKDVHENPGVHFMPKYPTEDMLKKVSAAKAARKKLSDAENARRRFFADYGAEGRAKYRKRIETVRQELSDTLDADFELNPDDLDMKAVKILESGGLSAKDYRGLLKKYENNQTMLRTIRKHLKGATEADLENKELRDVYLSDVIGRQADESYLDTFDDLNSVFERGLHSGVTRAMWDDLTAEAIEEF